MKISIKSCEGEGLVLFVAVAAALLLTFLAKYLQNKNFQPDHEETERHINKIYAVILEMFLSTHPALLTPKGLFWQKVGFMSLALFLVLGSILFALAKQGVVCAIS